MIPRIAFKAQHHILTDCPEFPQRRTVMVTVTILY